MKPALRDQVATSFAATSALLAAFALGCSGAEGIELLRDSVATPGGDGSASSTDASERESERAESAGTTEPTTHAEQPETSPRAETPAATLEPPAPTSEHEPSTPTTEVDEATASEPAREPEDEPAAAAPVQSNTMRVSGRQLLDACGQPFVVRGVEQILGNQLPEGNDWLGLVREIASTGANAVRVLPGVNTLTTGDVDEILTFIGEQGMVAFIDPLNGHDWYAQSDVRAMLKKHERFLIIDAYGEPQYDDIERWHNEAKDALVRMRGLGYEVPFTVYANQFGRGLPSLFDYGAEILAADPLHNTFLGWQAYWGQGGYYQQHYGYSLSEAVDAIVDSGLPIQLGLDYVTDSPDETADYGALMTGAEENGIGWLWWDFYNPYGRDNNLSQDGTAENLTSTGRNVLGSHPASISKTAQRACGL